MPPTTAVSGVPYYLGGGRRACLLDFVLTILTGTGKFPSFWNGTTMVDSGFPLPAHPYLFTHLNFLMPDTGGGREEVGPLTYYLEFVGPARPAFSLEGGSLPPLHHTTHYLHHRLVQLPFRSVDSGYPSLVTLQFYPSSAMV